MRYFLFASCIFAAPAFATCPAPPDISEAMNGLIDEIRQAPNDSAGREISDQMWQLWLTAPDEAAQELLDEGMRFRSSYDFLNAVASYSRLIDYCPDYAEGFNQRAYIHFLRGDFEAALVDLDDALLRAPYHVGALSGRALTLMNLGRLAEARAQLESALELNPWLSERMLMAKGGPLEKIGKDI